MKVYDDYEELEDAMEEEENDDWDDDWDDDAVIAVTFESSSKRYHYYTDNLSLERGDKLLIRQYQNKEVVVTVSGYSNDDSQANKALKIIRKIDSREETKRRTNKFKKEKVPMKKAAKAIENTKDAVMEAKDVAVKFQKGSAVIVAIKTALFESNAVPAKAKLLIEAGNGVSDLVIGLLLQIAAETFTESEIIQEASRNANFAGAVSASSEFTMIQDLIEKIVGSAVGSINTKTSGSAKKPVSGSESAEETEEK